MAKRTFKRATSPDQKKEVLGRLEKLWLKNPNLRLGQLIGNVYHYPSGIDPYHDEDYDFITKLEEGYEETE